MNRQKSSSAVCRSQTLACFCLLLVFCLDSVHSQAYHFSKGWMPGRKRSPMSSYPTDQMEQDNLEISASSYPQNLYCQIRPQVRRILSDLIKAELNRLNSECDVTKDASNSYSDLAQSFRQWNYKRSDE